VAQSDVVLVLHKNRIEAALIARGVTAKFEPVQLDRAGKYFDAASYTGTTMKSILDSAFRYTPSAQTDLRKTFARLRREQRQADLMRVKAIAANVTVLPTKEPRVGDSKNH